ncbi:MAG: hypothetical protein QM541_08745, partial [Flavobacterium sp.]|nr:hypothetical protein [Flavobacterium sp.]
MKTFTKWLFIASLTVFFGPTLKAQSWKTLGDTKEFSQASLSSVEFPNPSGTPDSYNSMVRDASGNLYVAYKDAANSKKLTVSKLTASTNTWSVVGTAGISTGEVFYISMVIDASANLYVAYTDRGNSDKLFVQKFTASGTTWAMVGSTSVSSGACYSNSMVIDASGNVYLAYKETPTNGEFLSVKKFTASGTTWEYVGVSAVTGSVPVYKISMAIDASGNLYVAYNNGDDFVLNVIKWTASSETWALMGSSIRVGDPSYNSIVVDGSGNAYVACSDNGTSKKLSVVKVPTSGTWSYVGGSAGISAGAAYYESMVRDTSGNLYVAFRDVANSGKLSVQKWDGTAWSYVGSSTGITAGAASGETMVIGATGNLFVAYADGNNSGKLAVQKYTPVGWSSSLGSADVSADGTARISTVKDTSGNLYVAYTDAANGDKLAVKKWTKASNTWSVVSTGISAGTAYYQSMVIDANSNLYVAYADGNKANKLTVQKFTASTSTWASVGSTGFTTTAAAYTSMVIDAYGTNLYVAYKESVNNKLVIQKWNGTTWAPVGAAAGISNLLVFHISMVIDGSSNLYVAYQDLTTSYAPRLYVQKYDSLAGTWAYVATTVATGISAGGALYNSMVRDASDNLYVAYRDENKSGKLTVQKYSGTSWSVLGTAGFSAGAATFNSMVVDASGNLYVAYQDGGNGNKLTVQKWNGTAWSLMGGTAGITDSTAAYQSMVLDATGNLYVAYAAGDNNKLTLQKYTATPSWASVGSSGISAGGTTYNAMVKDGSGNMYVAYTDGGNGNKLSVQKWTKASNTWALLGRGISADTAIYNSMVIDGDGNLYVAYADGSKAGKLAIQKYTASSSTWDTLRTGISKGRAAYNSMVIDGYGNLYVAYADSVLAKDLSPGSNDEFYLQVQKWTKGTNTWSYLGYTIYGISNTSGRFNSMVVDGSGNLYLAYLDSHPFGGFKYQLFVQKYDSLVGSWGYVGCAYNAGISDTARYISMVRDATGNLYVAYQDGPNGNKLTVRKWTEGAASWSVLGSVGISAGVVAYNSMVVDASGNLYVAYQDGGNGNKLTVQKWNVSSSGWSVVGSAGVSVGAAAHNSMVLDGSNLNVVYSSPQLFGQTYNKDNFYSVATGVEASNLANWNSSTTNAGSPATSFNSGDDFVVQPNHTVTNTGTINLGTGNLVVNAAGQFITSGTGTTSLDTLTINSGATATVTGNLQVAGSITNNGTLNA